jgi:hypothetical protein
MRTPVRRTREEQMLCRISRVPSAHEPVDLERLRDPRLDWNVVWNLALRHEVQPLAWAWLRFRDERRAAVPHELAQSAERRFFATALRNRSRAAELRTVLETLQQAKVDVISVKGVALAELVYGESAPRTFDDLDIVVAPEKLEDAREALRAIGYRGRTVPTFAEVAHRFHDVQLFRPVDGAEQCLEVHWDLWPPARFASMIDDLWARSRTATVAGVRTRVLADEDVLLHLAIHRTSSALRLRFLCDIAELLRQRHGTLDFDALESRSRQVGARVALHMALSLASRLLDAPVPASVLDRTRPGRARLALLDRTCGERALFRRVAFHDHRQQPRLAYRILEIDRPARVARAFISGALRKASKAAYHRRAMSRSRGRASRSG